MTCRKRSFFTSRAPMLFAARGRGSLLIMPRPLLGCQNKAEIKNFFYPTRTYAFHGEGAWHPPDKARPSNFLFSKSLDQEIFADVSFVSVLAMVLSEY